MTVRGVLSSITIRLPDGQVVEISDRVDSPLYDTLIPRGAALRAARNRRRKERRAALKHKGARP